jgi:hypothetical protein
MVSKVSQPVAPLANSSSCIESASISLDSESLKCTTVIQQLVKLPCDGLSEQDDAKVGIYLKWTGASGRGSPSVTQITKELHLLDDRKGQMYAMLSNCNKEKVLHAQEHAQIWKVNQEAQ